MQAGEGLELLTTTEMALADRAAVAAGIPSLDLMETAGRAVAAEAARMVAPGVCVSVLCGPGNNGGDGFVAARYLREWGFPVRLACLVPEATLRGDAAEMARRWPGETEALSAADTDTLSPLRPIWAADLLVDALFGAGLSRDLDGASADIVRRINRLRAASHPRQNAPRILAVDVPSGLDGTTGAVRGIAVEADRTITFFRRKPGHLLMPGRRLCGEVVVADIGIPPAVLPGIAPRTFANAPRLWQHARPDLALDSHKYTRGHAVVVSGPPDSTGAARLGARGALRAGAGLVTVASPRAAFPVNAAHLTAIMLKPFDVPAGLERILADKRLNAVLIGPGCGVGAETRDMTRIALASGAAIVLDADALTSFAESESGADVSPATGAFGFVPAARLSSTALPADLFVAIKAGAPRPVVLTPHEGEFKRLFPGIAGDKLGRARRAAAESGAVIVLKGPDTVVAHPDGRAAINENAPPWLATAGSGDVLAGFLTGLLAQQMRPFEAAAAAVWLHGACAAHFGPGLIAEDIPESLPAVLRSLASEASR